MPSNEWKHTMVYGFIFILVVAFGSMPVAAQRVAIDFTVVLTDFSGKPLLVKDQAGKEEPLTLGTVTCNALGGAYQDEANLAGSKRLERYALCLRVRQATDATLTTEEKMLLVNRDTGGLIGKAYPGSLIYPQAAALIDPQMPQQAAEK